MCMCVCGVCMCVFEAGAVFIDNTLHHCRLVTASQTQYSFFHRVNFTSNFNVSTVCINLCVVSSFRTIFQSLSQAFSLSCIVMCIDVKTEVSLPVIILFIILTICSLICFIAVPSKPCSYLLWELQKTWISQKLRLMHWFSQLLVSNSLDGGLALQRAQTVVCSGLYCL